MPTGDAIMVFCFVFLAFGLMISGYALKKAQLAVAASVAWFLLGIYSYAHVAVLWDAFYCLFVFGMSLSLASILETVALMRSEQIEAGKEEREEERDEEFHEERDWQRERREWRLGAGGSKPVLRLPMPKPSKYSKTGVHKEEK